MTLPSRVNQMVNVAVNNTSPVVCVIDVSTVITISPPTTAVKRVAVTSLDRTIALVTLSLDNVTVVPE